MLTLDRSQAESILFSMSKPQSLKLYAISHPPLCFRTLHSSSRSGSITSLHQPSHIEQYLVVFRSEGRPENDGEALIRLAVF